MRFSPSSFSRQQLRKHLTHYWHIYLIFLVFIVAFSVVSWIYRNQINPDGISYIQAARHYASFEFSEAINGYWAPLLSWILIPFIWLHIDPLLGFHIINFSLSLGLLIALTVFLNKRQKTANIEKYVQFCFLGTFAILLSVWTNATVTPDLLSGVALVVAIIAIYGYETKKTTKHAVLLGIALSLLYFSKSIGLYVALVLCLAILAHAYYKHRKLPKTELVILSVFGALSLIWIGLISIKYHTPTISTASSYNFALYGPDHPAHPQTVEGYLPVRHKDDIWGWDDPSYFKLPSWKINENKRYYFSYVLRNVNDAFSLLFTSSPLIILGLLAIVLKKKDKYWNNAGNYLALASFLILGTYSLIYIEARYLWFITIPIIAFSAILLRDKIKNIKPLAILLSIVLVATSFSLIPIAQNGKVLSVQQGDLKYLARQSAQHLPKYAKVATSGKFQYCFFATVQCVGYYTLNGNISHDNDLIQLMRSQGIEYYIDFDNLTEPLEITYHGQSSPQTCYDYYKGKDVPCPSTSLTVYKL